LTVDGVHQNSPSNAELVGPKVDYAAFWHEAAKVAILFNLVGVCFHPTVADNRRGLLDVDGQEVAALGAEAEA
jgi:hypothetical protein